MNARPAFVLATGFLSVLLLSGSTDAAMSDFGPVVHGPDRLVTNEYAHWNPHDLAARRSRYWDVTSGSLFVHDDVWWTGRPDAASPNVSSSNGTGSSVFRMTSWRHEFKDVRVAVRIRNIGLTDVGHAAPSNVDGVHLFLRWHSESELYVVSLNRRDNLIVVKKKSPGGDVNGGTYFTLGQVQYSVPYGEWQEFTAEIVNQSGAVGIVVSSPGRTLLSVTDVGRDAPVIDGPGAIGLRGDNCEFEFDGLMVTKGTLRAGTVGTGANVRAGGPRE